MKKLTFLVIAFTVIALQACDLVPSATLHFIGKNASKHKDTIITSGYIADLQDGDTLFFIKKGSDDWQFTKKGYYTKDTDFMFKGFNVSVAQAVLIKK